MESLDPDHEYVLLLSYKITDTLSYDTMKLFYVLLVGLLLLTSMLKGTFNSAKVSSTYLV